MTLTLFWGVTINWFTWITSILLIQLLAVCEHLTGPCGALISCFEASSVSLKTCLCRGFVQVVEITLHTFYHQWPASLPPVFPAVIQTRLYPKFQEVDRGLIQQNWHDTCSWQDSAFVGLFFFFKTIATITHSVIIPVVPNTLCHGNQTKIAHSCSHADFNTHSPDSGKLKSWGSSTYPHRRTMLGSCYLFHKCPTGNPKTKLETDTTLNNIFENMDNRGWSFFNSLVLNSL